MVRMTMAEAVVRFLAAQQELDGDVPSSRGVWAIFGHGNVAGLGPALHGARAQAADLARAQRAGHGARRDRLRQGARAPPHDGVHHLDRTRREQHGDRRGARARQSPAGAVPSGRCVRQPAARPGAAAARGVRRSDAVGQRLLPAGVALLRPHHAARADSRQPARGTARAARSRRMRAGDARASAGCADRGVRLPGGVLPAAACIAFARPLPDRAELEPRRRVLEESRKSRSSSRAAA